jgi:hypothetical protein
MSLLIAPSKTPEKPKASVRLMAALTGARRARRGGASEVNGQVSTVLPLRLPGGKRLIRTADGKMIEVPPEVTNEELARMQVEATAAQALIGKGPPPQPVPDVKQPAKKEGKEAKGQPSAKLARGGKGAGGGKPGAAAAVLRRVSASKVGLFLIGKAAPVLARGNALLSRLRQNEQTHDEAAEKRQQTDAAVVIPVSDEQSKSNAGQVGMVDAKPAPVADENKGKQQLQQSLAANVPKNMEDADNFKRDMKAQHMGADVLSVVQGDKNAVVTTFSDMEKTPPPTPSGHTPQELPPPQAAPGTSALNLGANAIAPLQKEHTDLSSFTKQGDQKLTEEGVTQAQLDMVDSGDLAAANKEKKGMEKAAKEQPIAMQKFVQATADKIDTGLKAEERKGRESLHAKRKGALGATAAKQKNTKTALQKKREETAAHINGLFTGTQDTVKKRLADLETQSMKRFDDGNAKATRHFEDSVKRDLDAYKDDRYSGFFGWARKAKDWLLGMDELPGVKAIFDRNRASFVNAVNKLVEDISADNKRVIQECKNKLIAVRKEIDEYVAKLDPALKDAGNKAAEEMAGKLAEMDKFVARKEEELQQSLKDKQQAAIKAIDEKIEKMKDEMGGALAKLGKLLLWAAKKFFTWALKKFGYSMDDIEGIISRGAAVLKAIFTKPIVFVKNLMNAAMLGIGNFSKNFLKHLKDALFEWLTGSLDGVTLPQTWDTKGILGLALQMVGISYANLRRHMVTVMTEPVVAGLEKTFTLVKTLVTEGPMAAWEQLKGMAAEMGDAFLDAVKDFVKWKIVEEAVKFIGAIFIPGAGIIKAIIGIYDTVVFFIQKAKAIMKMIGSFLGAIGEIAAGNIGSAAQAMEDGLARGLSLVVSFLAKLLRLDGITAKIRAAIQKIKGKVDDVLLKVAKWVWGKAGKLVGAAKAKAGDVVDAAKDKVAGLIEWWKEKQPFKNDDGESHTLLFQGTGDSVKLAIKSDLQAVEAYLDGYEKGLAPENTKGAADLKVARSVFDRAKRVIFTPQAKTTAEQERRKEIKTELAKVSAAFARLAGKPPEPGDFPKSTEPDNDTHSVEHIVGDAKPGAKPAKGPNTGTPGWKEVYEAGLTTATDRWVQMHIISEQLGGKGVAANLISAPNSINTGPFRSYEHATKGLAKAKSGKIKNVVWVKVDVDMAGVYAKSIRGRSGLYFWKGSSASPKWLKNERYSFYSQAAIPAPQLDKEKVFSLNFSSGTDLAKLTGDSKLIELIKQGRRYPSIAIFVSRMEKSAEEAGVKNYKAKIQALLGKKVVLNEPPAKT